MANSSADDWDEGSPAGSAAINAGDDEIRNLRAAVGDRFAKEHITPAASGVGGEHLEGSARVYYASSAPTKKPDGTTDLDTNDEGRVWIDSSTKRVYYYTGSAWTELRLTPPVAILEDRANSGSNGGSSVAATWNKRVLDTEYDPDGIVDALSSGVFTLNTGTYRITAWSTVYNVGANQCRLRRTSGTPATIAVGSSEYSPAGGNTSTSVLCIEFSVSGSTTFELQHYTELLKANSGLGLDVSSGETNRYAIVKIEKVKAT